MIQCRSCGNGWEFRWGQGEQLENSDDHDRNELNLDQHPQSSPGRHSIKRCRLPQESLQLLKVYCLLLGRSWRGLLKLKVNLMQLIITDNYALNHTTLGLIIYWEMINEKKKDDGSWQTNYMQKGILIKGGLLFPPSFEEEVDVLKQPAFLSVSPSPPPLSFPFSF